MPQTSFGRAIGAARKGKSWSLRELASRILHEDGSAISQQYLNDIEHDRRSPSSDHLVQQFAGQLGLERDWLYFLAGRLPDDIRKKSVGENQIVEGMAAFRKTLRNKTSRKSFIMTDTKHTPIKAYAVFRHGFLEGSKDYLAIFETAGQAKRWIKRNVFILDLKQAEKYGYRVVKVEISEVKQ
jgi:transcriptional regulator with XRE-family HTH domain